MNKLTFHYFHLMPWPHLPADFDEKYDSAWVTLPNSIYDPKEGHKLYNRYLDEIERADKLGWDSVIVNEHHQNAYGTMPSPNLMAAALTQRIKHAKIGIVGNALPLHDDPLRVAEEIAMLDVISGGRIISGFVRGTGMEYFSYNINPTISRERMDEAHDLIIQAWTRPGPFAFEGEHYHYRYVNIWPRPIQQPHPPIWIPSMGSSETIKWAAAPERKYPFLVTFSGRDLVARYLNLYREQAKQFGYEASGDQLGWASPVYVADTDERAREEARDGIETLFNDFLAVPWEMLLPAGYMSLSSMKNTIKMRKSLGSKTRHTLEELMEIGTVFVGSPRTVREQIERQREKTGASNLVAMLQFGVLSNELTKRNMEMFAA